MGLELLQDVQNSCRPLEYESDLRIQKHLWLPDWHVKFIASLTKFHIVHIGSGQGRRQVQFFVTKCNNVGLKKCDITNNNIKIN